MTSLRLPIWQFVRIMVELERTAGAGERGVFGAWRGQWQEVDRALEELGTSDFAAFADLMMNNEVALELRTPAHRAEVIAVLDRVTAAMQREIDARGTVKQRQKDLRFEVGALRTLRKSLAGQTRPEAKKPRAPSRRAPRRSPPRR